MVKSDGRENIAATSITEKELTCSSLTYRLPPICLTHMLVAGFARVLGIAFRLFDETTTRRGCAAARACCMADAARANAFQTTVLPAPGCDRRGHNARLRMLPCALPRAR